MPMTVRTLAAALAMLALPAAAAAQGVQVPAPETHGAAGEAIAPDDESAFTMTPAEGRHLKIDRRTGRVSVCSEESGSWSCRLVADDRLAYEEEIERLQSETERLEDRVGELEQELATRSEGENWIGPEDEKKLDEFLDFSDKAIRRFFGMVQDLKRDLDQPDTL